jgi:hypothetical protein
MKSRLTQSTTLVIDDGEQLNRLRSDVPLTFFSII